MVDTRFRMTNYTQATAYFTAAVIFVTGVLISLLLYQANERFISEDRLPELFPLVPKTIDQMGKPAVAQVGLYVKDFTEFNMLENEFEFSGILWFLFDPSVISIKTLDSFSFEKGKILEKSPPTTRIVQGKLLARYDVRVKFKSNLSFARFPFDSHTLYIILDNRDVSPGELAFESSYNELTISPEIELTDWKLYATRVYTGYSIARLEKHNRETDVAHPRAVFALEYEHAGIRHAMLIVLPLLLIFFMSLFTFSIDSDYYKSITSLAAGSVTAMLGYRFVIERLSPQVGYFMQTDYIFFLFLVLVIVSFFINVGMADLREKYSRPIVLVMGIVVVVAFFILLRETA